MLKRSSLLLLLGLLINHKFLSQEAFLFDSANIIIKGININSTESEFSPFKIGNTLYYTSSKEREIGLVTWDPNTDHQLLDIYSAILKDSVTFKKIKPLSNKINNPLNQGTCFFDMTSSKLYFSTDVPTGNPKKKFKLAIYSSILKKNSFAKAVPELVLPDTFSASHPYIYNNKLYFSSNQNGGAGKTDIYFAEFLNGKWDNITNLKEVNTEFYEYFPFAINEKEIYFSSDRTGGFGKMDLYKYNAGDATYPIKNLGVPINSKDDDFGIWLDSLEESGYFSTSRSGNNDDILYFKKTWPTFKNCADLIKEDYCYNLSEESTMNTDSMKGFYYEWTLGDGTKQKGLEIRHCFPGPGNYAINLNVVDSTTGTVFMTQATFDLKVDSIVQLKINSMDTVAVNRNFGVSAEGSYLPDKKILNYYYEIENKKIKARSIQHVFSKPGIYQVKLGISYNAPGSTNKELMCSTKNIVCVDSATWAKMEDRKIKEAAESFAFRYLKGDTNKLSDVDLEAALTKFNKFGLNGEKVVNEVKNFLEKSKQKGNRLEDLVSVKTESGPTSKLTTFKLDTLLQLKEDKDVTFKVHLGKSKTHRDTTMMHSKGLVGIHEELIANEYHYTYGEEKQIKNLEKYYKAALKAGIKDPVVIGYKNDAIIFDQSRNMHIATFEEGQFILNPVIETPDVPLATNKKDKTSKGKELPVKEGKDITFRVHLGTSKTKKDTSFLKELGLSGVKEEFINNEYHYTFGNVKTRKETEKYYKAALVGGIQNPIVISYKKDSIISGQDKLLRPATFDESKIIFKKIALANEQYYANKTSTTSIANNLPHLKGKEKEPLHFKVHYGTSPLYRDTSYLYKYGIIGIDQKSVDNVYHYTYGDEEKLSEIDKYYKASLNAGIDDAIIIAYIQDSIIPEHKKLIRPATFADQLSFKNNIISAISLDSYTYLKEGKGVTFRVHLGTSTTKKDTTLLNKHGIYGITEQYIDNLYHYTYGVKTKIKDIEVYFKDILKIGLSDAVVVGYLNNILMQEHRKLIGPVTFDSYLFDEERPQGDQLGSMINDWQLKQFVPTTDKMKTVFSCVELNGDITRDSLFFKVQIAAYKIKRKREFPHLIHLGRIETRLLANGLTVLTIGEYYKTLREAYEHSKKVILSGQTDAFVTVIYRGKRIYLQDLQKMGIFVTK